MFTELLSSKSNESLQKNSHCYTETEVKHYVSESAHETQDNAEISQDS